MGFVWSVDLFGTFLRLRAGRPGKTLSRLFFAVLGTEGVETAVDGWQGRKSRLNISIPEGDLKTSFNL